MTFSKPELRQIRSALLHAIDSEESYIDSHHVSLSKRAGKIVRLIPKQYRSVVDTSRRRICAWRKLLDKMSAASTKGNLK